MANSTRSEFLRLSTSTRSAWSPPAASRCHPAGPAFDLQPATADINGGAGYTLTGGSLALAGTGASNWINMNAGGEIGSAIGHLRIRGTGEAAIRGGGILGGNLATVRQTAGTVTINDCPMVGGNNVANSQRHYIMDGGSLTIAQRIHLGRGHSTGGGPICRRHADRVEPLRFRQRQVRIFPIRRFPGGHHPGTRRRPARAARFAHPAPPQP
jgi:hypothetical protein